MRHRLAFPSRTLRGVLAAAVLAAASLGPSPGALAATIVDQTFDDRIQLAETPLVLNGLGTRSVAWLHGYAAGLYLQRKAANTAQVIADKGPKRIQIRMMLDVDAKEFTKAIHVGIERNCDEAERAALKERIETFAASVDAVGKLHKGDLINLDYLPARGMVFTLNGTPRGNPLPGDDLYDGILKIFLGEKPVDRKLKAGLLGAA